jgi:hypothetical protein
LSSINSDPNINWTREPSTEIFATIPEFFGALLGLQPVLSKRLNIRHKPNGFSPETATATTIQVLLDDRRHYRFLTGIPA